MPSVLTRSVLKLFVAMALLSSAALLTEAPPGGNTNPDAYLDSSSMDSGPLNQRPKYLSFGYHRAGGNPGGPG
jgi:hypothetical protein